LDSVPDSRTIPAAGQCLIRSSGPIFDANHFQSRTSLHFRLQFVAKIFFGYS
jgi:hypothetical protein